MPGTIFNTIQKRLTESYTVRLLLIILAIILIAFFATESSLRVIISKELIEEKEVMLFGLATQLDNALDGTYEDIINRYGGVSVTREEKIKILHDELWEITDFVASGVSGVGVGYYSKELDAILTYGPEAEFGHTIGQSIFEGHLGYQVMAEGQSMVQHGELVRGNIMNCMRPVIRNGTTIGYIWANETLEDVSSRLSIVFKQILFFTIIIFILLYVAVFLPTWYFNRRIDLLISDIDIVMHNPKERLSKITGPLASVVSSVNSLLDKIFFFKSHNEFIFDSLKSGILAISIDGEILLANPAFLEIVDMEGRNLPGEKYLSVLPDEICSFIDNNPEMSVDSRKGDIIFKGRIFEVYSNDVYNDENINIGVVFIFRDQTLIKLYERRLQEQQRLVILGEMGLNIAHEIKNPLTAVKGFSQLMHRRNLPVGKMDHYLELMDDELNRIDKLLNDLLINGGKSKLQPELVNILDMLSEFLVIYSNSYPKIKFSLKTDLKGSCFIRMDKNNIAQLLDNLVKNSVESIMVKPDPKSKNINFYLCISSDIIVLKVCDSGEGIPQENRSRVLTPFFTTKKEGTGLGLSFCLGIIERHKGKIEINSEEGVYTEIVMTFNRKELEKLNEA